MVPIFKNMSERSTPKNYSPVGFFYVVVKSFEKVASNTIVDHLEKSGLFSDYQYCFRSF